LYGGFFILRLFPHQTVQKISDARNKENLGAARIKKYVRSLGFRSDEADGGFSTDSLDVAS